MMAFARPPAPSLGLLRFLRSQTENFIFSSNHASPTCRRALCASRHQIRTMHRAREEHILLQAGFIDLELFQRPRTSRTKATPRNHLNSTFFSSTFGARYGSTGRPPDTHRLTWREILTGARTKKEASPLQPDDLPGSSDDADSSPVWGTRRQHSKQAAMEPTMVCTEVDDNGRTMLRNGEFKKSELISKFGLQPRDLRKIDSSNLPHILVRPSAILMNLLHLRVLITSNRVLLFDVHGSESSYSQTAFLKELRYKLEHNSAENNGNLPYEFRAVETVLQSVTQVLESDWESVRDPVISIISDLEDDIDREKLRFLLIHSKRMSTFEQKAKLVRDAIEELLEADDDLAAMYLTEKTQGKYRGVEDHTEVEMLLESYHKLCDEIVQEASNLSSGIRITEDVIRVILDANRNQLMLLDLKISLATLGLAMGTFIAGLYGMNLENFIEETNWGFGAVTGVSVILSIWVGLYGMKKLRRVQRVKMQGETRRDLSRAWYHDEGHMGLLDARNRERLRNLNKLKAYNTNQMKQMRKKWWSTVGR